MKINYNLLKNITIAVLALVLIGSMVKCSNNQRKVNNLTLENQTLKTQTNQLGQQVVTSQTEVTSVKGALKDATDSLFNLRKKYDKKIKDVIAFYKGITHTTIDSAFIPYIDSNARKVWEDSVARQCSKVIDYYEANSIFVPKTARDSTEEYTADFTATLEGIRINNLDIPDSQYLRFVTLKGGFFKKDQNGKRHFYTKRSIQVQVLHTNKLIHVTGQASAIYQAPKKPRVLERVLLIGAGIFLGTQL